MSADRRHSDGVVELEFRTDDERYPLVSITRSTGCRAELQQTLPRSDDAYAMYYSTSGACPDHLLEEADRYDDLEARLISRLDDGGLFEVIVPKGDEYFMFSLAEAGAIPRHMWGDDGIAHIVAEVPPGKRVGDVIERFQGAHPTVELIARRQREYAAPMFTCREFQAAVDDVLTARQSEVLLAAFVAGYFEWPREKSAAEMARELDMAAPTFSQHMRAAQRKVFTLLFQGYRAEE